MAGRSTVRPRAIGVVAFLLGLGSAAVSARAQTNEFRGLWVDAWGGGFFNSNEVRQLIADCRAWNFNAILVQMRRRGDAFYSPGIAGNDPRTSALATNFDALQELITQAHSGSPRIQVHCWVTTHLVWSGFTPPTQPDHVLNVRPDLLTHDSSGGSYLAEGYYLDPGHPDATLWNYVMATNIVRRYDVDGLHWDYIRYPQQDSGYNPTAVARYNAEFGLTDLPSPADPQFSHWRRRQVTDFLRWVNSDLLAAKSNLVISCAVFSHREDAYLHRFQDWAAWNQEGIIDVCMPMGYTPDNAVFQTRLRDAAANQGVRTVYFGQAAYLNPRENTLWQLRLIRQHALPGSVFYSYRVPNSGRENRSATFSYLRMNFQPVWVDVPEIPWKTSPTNGIFRGTVTEDASGAAVDNATVAINIVPARTQRTGAHGTFAFFETATGDYTVTISATGLGSVTTNVTITAGNNPPLSVSLPPRSLAVGLTNFGIGPTNHATELEVPQLETSHGTNPPQPAKND